MFGTILEAINSYFRKDITFCRSIYVKKVMKLPVFICEQPSYAESIFAVIVLVIFKKCFKV